MARQRGIVQAIRDLRDQLPVKFTTDDVERRLVAGLGRLAPGEQPVAREHHAARRRVLVAETPEPQPELEAGPPPWQSPGCDWTARRRR